MPQLAETEAGPAPAEDWLWARDVAALAGITVETVTQYLWQGSIPPPDEHAHPPWRTSGVAYPRWRRDNPALRAWLAAREPPGRPRNDGRPRTRRKAAYAKPGRKTVRFSTAPAPAGTDPRPGGGTG